MSRIATQRQALTDALEAGVTAPWRVHKYTPPSVVAPCVYIGAVSLTRTTVGAGAGVVITVAEFDVYAVADGADRAQLEQLDEQVATVWDAAYVAGGTAQRTRPTVIDAGGPNLHAQVVTVEMQLRATTMCTPTLED